jgi:hypothetical protein
MYTCNYTTVSQETKNQKLKKKKQPLERKDKNLTPTKIVSVQIHRISVQHSLLLLCTIVD